jgi:hypothetical protein
MASEKFRRLFPLAYPILIIVFQLRAGSSACCKEMPYKQSNTSAMQERLQPVTLVLQNIEGSM